MATNPAFDYASRNFANIKQDLLRRATTVVPEWTDRDPSDFGMVFVDLWSYMGDVIHYYIDRASKEAFIQTATQKESVLAYANLYDYTPNFRTSAESTVYVANSSSASVSIPQYTQFVSKYNDDYYYFYSTSEVTSASASTVAVSVREGTRVVGETLTSSSSGQPSQRYRISTTKVAPSTIQVYVTEEGSTQRWIRYANVTDIPLGTPGYVIYITANSEVEVVFGNRANGRIPVSGCTITVDYTVSSGVLGNVPQNSITSFVSPISASLSITSSTAATGGGDGESVESIRRSLQAVVRSQDRAVTLEDYKDIALSINGVYRSVASYVSGAGGASVTVYPLPYVNGYTSFTSNSVSVSADLQTLVANTINPKKVLGTTLTVASSITVNRLNITADVKVSDNYVAAWVKSDVLDAIDNLFSFDAIDFGKEIRLADLYKLIMNIEGVDYCTISVFQMYDPSNTPISTGSLSPVEILRKGTVSITTTGGMTTTA